MQNTMGLGLTALPRLAGEYGEMDDWPELDELIQELQQANEERWQRTQELRQQLDGLQPQLELVELQFRALQVDEHLRLLNERALGGLGNVEVVHGGVGIEYAAALVWPPHIHPGVDGGQPDEEGVYRIDVWLGPGLQDGRGRIRIAGARRLEAVLPTSTERFRSALLSVFRDPQRVARPAGTETVETAGQQEAPAGDDTAASEDA
jgi:hypothetical protein